MRTAPWHLMICYCTFVTCVYLLLYCCCHDASHGTITLPPPYVTVAMRLLFIDAVLVSDVTGLRAVRKRLSHQSTESFPNGIINMLLRPSFVFFLVCSGFLHWFSFLLFNDDLNWGLQLFHVVLGSLWAPGCRCALGVMLVATGSWEGSHCSTLSAFVSNGSHRGSTESQSLRNGFEPCADWQLWLWQLIV